MGVPWKEGKTRFEGNKEWREPESIQNFTMLDNTKLYYIKIKT